MTIFTVLTEIFWLAAISVRESPWERSDNTCVSRFEKFTTFSSPLADLIFEIM
jgi:hypothetical protein